MQRKLNHVFEIELNFIGGQRIGEPIERPFQPGFKVFENTFHFFSQPPRRAPRAVDR